MIIVSLYDESGLMVEPWAKAGHGCYCFDIEQENERTVNFPGGGFIAYINADLRCPDIQEFIRLLRPAKIFGFSPCTDLATCGAKHFETKRQINPAFQIEAVELARITEKLANDTGAAWFAENPRSVLSTMWRKPDYKFDPSDFGGYLPADDRHPLYPGIIPPRDAYPKETWIWSGNGFVIPERSPVPAMAHYPGWSNLGGKSKRTKKIRSTTPRGWAVAVFEANKAA